MKILIAQKSDILKWHNDRIKQFLLKKDIVLFKFSKKPNLKLVFNEDNCVSFVDIVRDKYLERLSALISSFGANVVFGFSDDSNIVIFGEKTFNLHEETTNSRTIRETSEFDEKIRVEEIFVLKYEDVIEILLEQGYLKDLP